MVARDREIRNAFTKDAQITAIRGARKYRWWRRRRIGLLDPKAGPSSTSG